MRLRATLVLLIATTAIQAVDESYRISRWGNSLVVTAPSGIGASPMVAAQLAQRVSLDFHEAPFAEVIDFLRSVSKLNIVVAPAVMQNAPKITLKANGMSLNSVFLWITKLSNTHISFVNEAFLISDTPVKQTTVTRIYDVTDMTMAIRDFPGPQLGLNPDGSSAELFPTTNSRGHTAESIEEIEALIRKVVEPGKWSPP